MQLSKVLFKYFLVVLGTLILNSIFQFACQSQFAVESNGIQKCMLTKDLHPYLYLGIIIVVATVIFVLIEKRKISVNKK